MSLKDLTPLLTGAGFPKLVHLRLKHGNQHDKLATALSMAPIVAQLETLDLSKGAMSDRGARALLKAVKRFEHLRRIDLEQNWIGDGVATKLNRRFGARVHLGAQHCDRYESTSE